MNRYTHILSTSLLLAASTLVSSHHVYFHSSSGILFEANPSIAHSSFGFSLGYQNGSSRSLITGAPHSDLIGKVFRCPIDNTLENATNVICDDINFDFNSLAPINRDYAPTLKYSLGVSIATLPNYFVSCAPLWTTTPNNTDKTYSYGTCFVFDHSVHRYKGMLEKYNENPYSVTPFDAIYGGMGWSTLVDEANKMLLIAKVVNRADVLTLNTVTPLEEAKSFVVQSNDASRKANWVRWTPYQNVGYSMASGKFFSNKTVYAVSVTSNIMLGKVQFLKISSIKIRGKIHQALNFLKVDNKHVEITDNNVASMYGASMCSADLNQDGFSDLLVGAPAQGNGDDYETGAIHIYIGGDAKNINKISRKRQIIGEKEGSRFGATIAASDIDGDNYPEIFVSAPYEENGRGFLYILYGHEVYKELLAPEINDNKKLSYTELKFNQVIESPFKTFGFSLQTIPDLDDNGCDELAVGSPGSSKILLFRCIPSINVNVTAELLGTKIVREQDSEFTVNVCLNVDHLKQKDYTAELRIHNEVKGNGAVIAPNLSEYDVTFPQTQKPYCQNVTVSLNDNEPGEYIFTTKALLTNTSMASEKKFNRLWVTLSPQSNNANEVFISRHCTGKECDPNLTMNINWSGSGSIYTLGSSESLVVSLKVENQGGSAFEGCLWVWVSGASVAKMAGGCGNSNGGYKCYMPTPFKRNAKNEIQINFNMSQPVNTERELFIRTNLYDHCQQTDYKDQNFTLLYYLSSENVQVKGISHSLAVTDIMVRDPQISTLYDVQEYLVVNEDHVTWKSLKAIISVEVKPFIQEHSISKFNSYTCELVEEAGKKEFHCNFDLMPRSTVKFIVSASLLKDSLSRSFVKGKVFIASNFTLHMTGTSDIKNTSVLTTVLFRKELSFAQNKALVISLAVIGAVVALAIVIIILFKMGFFKRNEKNLLELLKQEHIRKQSILFQKQAAPSSRDRSSHGDEGGLDMEVEDDNAFEIIDINDQVNTLEKERKISEDIFVIG